VQERLRFLVDVGLEYFTLERRAESLSGGEAQRIRLASQVGSGLTGVMYILDEPSIGLHQRDNRRLLTTLAGAARHRQHVDRRRARRRGDPAPPITSSIWGRAPELPAATSSHKARRARSKPPHRSPAST
jgi:hypothetical protein